MFPSKDKFAIYLLQLLCIGPTGTGKTLTIADKLLKNMPGEFITHFLMFSARTSANQTQDCIDCKLDKRYEKHVSCISISVLAMFHNYSHVHQAQRRVWTSNRETLHLLHR